MGTCGGVNQLLGGNVGSLESTPSPPQASAYLRGGAGAGAGLAAAQLGWAAYPPPLGGVGSGGPARTRVQPIPGLAGDPPAQVNTKFTPTPPGGTPNYTHFYTHPIFACPEWVKPCQTAHIFCLSAGLRPAGSPAFGRAAAQLQPYPPGGVGFWANFFQNPAAQAAAPVVHYGYVSHWCLAQILAAGVGAAVQPNSSLGVAGHFGVVPPSGVLGPYLVPCWCPRPSICRVGFLAGPCQWGLWRLGRASSLFTPGFTSGLVSFTSFQPLGME